MNSDPSSSKVLVSRLCKYFAIWSKNTHISKSIFNLRSHANSVHISILKVTLDQLYFDSSHVQTVS